MTLFKPAIALMNHLKYPKKFLLISLLFVLPLALVMNLLLSEINSRIDFTQKEIYGNTYLRPLNQLWRHIPRRQLILQRQFYKDTQNLGGLSQSQSAELLDLQNKIEQEFNNLAEIDRYLARVVKTGEKLQEIKFSWQSLLDSQEFLEFRSHDRLIEQIDRFHIHIVDFSNLILDPDLDTYYLMDAIANKLPEMQKILYKIIQIEAEVVFKKQLRMNKSKS